jgi:hypothetical protein
LAAATHIALAQLLYLRSHTTALPSQVPVGSEGSISLFCAILLRKFFRAFYKSKMQRRKKNTHKQIPVDIFG